MSGNYKQPWRIVVFIILLFGILAATYIPVKQVVLSNLKADPKNKLKYILDEKLDREIMIWGPSVAKHHLNAPVLQKELGVSAFNMGEDGLFFSQYKGLLSEYLKYANSRHTLVVVVSVFDFSKREKIALQNNFLPYLDNESVFQDLKAIDRSWALKNKYVPFYKVVNWNLELYKTSFQNYLLPKQEYNDSLLGFAPLNKPEHFVYDSQKEIIKECSIDSSVVRQFIDVLNQRPRGMRVVIQVSPVYGGVINEIKYLDQFEKAVNQVATETNSLVFNYMKREVFKDSSLFCYNAHLNATGADMLTKLFITDLKGVKNPMSKNFK